MKLAIYYIGLRDWWRIGMDVNDFGKKRKKTIFFSSAFIVALVLIVGLSYSFFVKSKKQEQGNVIATSCFDIDLVGQNPINLASAYPVSVEDGMTTVPYTFTITNTCSNQTRYDVSLEALENTTFGSSSIRVSLENESKLFSEYNRGSLYFDDSKEARIIASGLLNKGDSKTFNLRLWIDENAPSTEQNKVFASKIIVYANLETTKPKVSDITVVPQIDSSLINYTIQGDETTTSVTCKWGTEEDNYSNTVVDATLSECNIRNLTASGNYYYQICAITLVGEACEKGTFTTLDFTVEP